MLMKTFQRFRRDEGGNPAMVFGFAVVPFLLAAGVAVDYGRGVVAKHELQVALDSAVLAAGSLRSVDEQERKDLGKAFFEANFDPAEYNMTVPSDLISINNNVVAADETVTVKTWFMQLANLLPGASQSNHDMEVKTNATALVPQVGKAEISLVLDYSGSMGGDLNGVAKYITMRDAAKDLISTITAGAEVPADIQYSLVPFSYGVKAELMRNHMTDPSYAKLSGTSRVESCLSGRKENATLDTEPEDGKRHRWQQDDLWYDIGPENKDRTDRCGAMLPLRTLTSNTTQLNADLDAWLPNGGTHISSGFQFGWHTISPNTVFDGGVTYDKVNHPDPEQRVLKAIVLLTDGAQTAPAYRENGDGQDNEETSDPTWPLNDTNGEANLEDLCANAKTAGVVVVTVAFDLDDADTINRLDTCASPKDAGNPSGAKFSYKADSITELQTAFDEIGNVLAEMVYLSD
ncbi:MAG: hypothetical protein GY948_25435 [Alphaproteobacteria bacterium]|nr:hypothetical protein [Alphaproteobacteria bacterium]